MEPNLMFHATDMFSYTDFFHLSVESCGVFYWLYFHRILYFACSNFARSPVILDEIIHNFPLSVYTETTATFYNIYNSPFETYSTIRRYMTLPVVFNIKKIIIIISVSLFRIAWWQVPFSQRPKMMNGWRDMWQLDSKFGRSCFFASLVSWR
jgi:hypothetical protein